MKSLGGMSVKGSGLSRLGVILTLAALMQAGCQEQVWVPGSSATRAAARRGPKITFDQTVHDFGEVSSNRKYTAQFALTNAGNGILRITDIRRCCGTTITLDKKELPPGESATLTIACDTGPHTGALIRPVRVISNDKTSPEATLTIKARVVPKVDYRPARMELVLDKENAGCPEITITSLDKQPFAIKGFQSTGGIVTAGVDPSVKATRFVLRPKVDLKKLEEHSAGIIAIALTHPELDGVTIRFTKKCRFQVKPDAVFLLHPRPQEPSINKVAVVSNYSEDFQIESVSSPQGMAKVLSQRTIAGGYQLEVEVTPPPRGGTSIFTDVVNIQLSNGEKLSLKCYVRYAGAAE
jgi:hypothetical protein